jgi:hypothetical protein
VIGFEESLLALIRLEKEMLVSSDDDFIKKAKNKYRLQIFTPNKIILSKVVVTVI